SNTKFVVHLKGGNYDSFYESSTELLKKCIVNFLKNCDSIIVLGPSLIKMYDFCPDIKSKIRVVFNALPQDTVNNYVKENTNTVNVVFLSNLIISKGYLDVLQASLEVSKFNIHFHFAGDFMLSPDDEDDKGDLKKRKEEFNNFIINNGLENNITYHGVLVGNKKNDLLKLGDIFILPTYYHVEGQPISIIEAMSFRNAIISTNYRSIPDIVYEGRNAIFVKPKKPEDIVNAITYLYENRNVLIAYQNNSYEYYHKKHIWSKHYSAMKEIFISEKAK
ncbi:glycosyltransferase, partial [Escherichia coli]|nr:glycosyltransferase [Escherichia coli]